MTCDEFQNRFSAYLDSDLPGWSRWKVENHLRGCPQCAGLLRDMAEVDNALLAAANANPAPPYITSAVMRRLPAMPPASRLRPIRFTWAAGLAVAVMQVTGLCGAYYWGFTRGSEAHRPVGPAVGAGAPAIGQNSPSPRSGAPVLPVSAPPRPLWVRPQYNFALPETLAVPEPSPRSGRSASKRRSGIPVLPHSLQPAGSR